MISVNERAAEIARRMIADAEALGVAVTTLANGATVIDAGIEVPGSLEAGRLFAEASLGGLGRVSLGGLTIGELWLPGVSLSVSHPAIACMASQYAGWAIRGTGFFAMGSGPARSLYCGEELFRRLRYRDRAEVAVLLLEGRKLPTEEIAAMVAARCGVAPEALYLIIAPTASIVASVQIAARVVETGLHKMLELGFDIGNVLSGFGTCPLAPVAADDLRAIGRTNDAVFYGGRAWYSVRADDEQIAAIVERLPSLASPDYGTPFYELFQRYGDFYQIDPMLFSPAEVFINNLNSGRTFHAGRINADLVKEIR